MKNYMYILCSCLLFMNSQVVRAQSTDFGIYGGINQSSITDLSGRENKTGFHFGIFTRISFSTIPFDIQPEIIYTRFNSNGGGPSIYERPPSHSFYSRSFEYFQIPILFKYNILNISPYAQSVFMGPFGSYKINADTFFSPGAFHEGISISEYVNDIDYGMIIGTEAHFDIQIVKFNLGIRYQFSMRDVISENVTAIIDEWGSFPSKEFLVEYFHGKKHRTISLYSGFSF